MTTLLTITEQTDISNGLAVLIIGLVFWLATKKTLK